MTDVEEEMLAFALSYTRLGLEVLPLHYPVAHGGRLRCSCGNDDCGSPAKHPYARLAPKGCLSASRDPRAVQRWFGGAPYNLGIRTGATSGIVVIDVDPRHGGEETLADLERRHGVLPSTWQFITGSDGQHIPFRHPGGNVPNSAGKLGPGIDVRGDGGFIVAPPSRHICGRRYAIDVDHHPDDVPLADMPDWLIEKVRATAVVSNGNTAAMPADWRKLVAEGVAEGCRNAAAARLAGYLMRRDVDSWVTLDLVRVWNLARCKPPLVDSEICTIVRSIAARELRRRRGGHDV
jgi:hypothetical protein